MEPNSFRSKKKTKTQNWWCAWVVHSQMKSYEEKVKCTGSGVHLSHQTEINFYSFRFRFDDGSSADSTLFAIVLAVYGNPSSLHLSAMNVSKVTPSLIAKESFFYSKFLLNDWNVDMVRIGLHRYLLVNARVSCIVQVTIIKNQLDVLHHFVVGCVFSHV